MNDKTTDKLVEHGVNALVRTGPRAIGAFVRAWLAVLALAVIAITYSSMADDYRLYGHSDLAGTLVAAILCAVIYISLPAAVVVAIAYVAIKF
jgi:hypothetical protein